MSLRIQKAVSGFSEATQGEPEELSEAAIESVVESQQEAHEMMSRFRMEMMRDLVVGCRDLTINDEVPSRDELLEALVRLEDLSVDLCAHIVGEGTVSEEEGKD